MTTVINIIPINYQGNPRNALGYAWQDYKNRIPGHDVIVDFIDHDKSKGMDWEAAAKQAMIDLGISSAPVNCMWCGGYSGDMSVDTPIELATTAAAGEEPIETAHNIILAERVAQDEQDNLHKHNPGYCTICHSYCYGDCRASNND